MVAVVIIAAVVVVALWGSVWLYIESGGHQYGNDGLTKAERAVYAARWRRGSGAPGTKEEMDALKRMWEQHR